MEKLYISEIVDRVYECVTIDYQANYIYDEICESIENSKDNILYYDKKLNELFIFINKNDKDRII